MTKITLPIRLIVVMLFLIINNHTLFSQNLLKDKATKYLTARGELIFTFKANSIQEINELSKIVSFDHGQNPITPLTIQAIANKQQFERFLDYNLTYTINDKLNSPKKLVMSKSNKYKEKDAFKMPAPLTFPLSVYPTYQDYADQMVLFATNNPSICQLIDIGGTSEGVSGGDKRLLFIKLSDNVGVQEQEPRMMYTSSMHGDEIAGYPLMLDLINYFITAYNDTGHSDHTRVKNLIDNSEIWINPSANPDGTYYNDPTNTSVANARRANANNWDLNRNYPDNVGGTHPDGNSIYELETQHFMTLADTYHFVLAANFHGGTEVVNYPWDNTYTRHADDTWFFDISKEYAVNCQDDELLYNGTSNYMDSMYTGYVWPGVTNGADWYRVEGGRQDYMNYYKQCKETTIELSNDKTPDNLTNPNVLLELWDWNREALIEYLIQGTYGFRGVVKDATNNNPIEATITLVGHDNTNSHTVSETAFGDYYRPVTAGTYDLLFTADCYQSFTLSSQTIANYETKVLTDVLLTPIANIPPNNLASSNIGGTTATVSWDPVTGANYDYRYREVGSPTWITVNTSNVSENIIGLNTSTLYEVQVRSTCNTTTSAYSSSIQFSTTNTITLHEGYFESGWDNWTSGGSDATRYTGDTFSYENIASIRIRDNSGSASTMTSEAFNLTSYSSIEINFYYYPNGMEDGEDFFLQYYNGSGWSTIATYVAGASNDFTNGSFYNDAITLNSGSYIFAANSQLRFQCDASNNGDEIYIDQVIITATPICTNLTYYVDADNDTYGDSTDLGTIYCNNPGVGFSLNNTDCDDTNLNVNPGVTEIPDNGIDDDCVGGDESALNAIDFIINQMTVFPNPFNDKISIKIPNELLNNSFRISLYDINGRNILNNKDYQIVNGEISIRNLNKLSVGSYFLKITHQESNTFLTKHLIKL